MKSKKEQLVEYGIIEDDVFMPAEFDDAFVGLSQMCWCSNAPVYDMDIIGGRDFPETPEDYTEPLFMRKLTEEEMREIRELQEDSGFSLFNHGEGTAHFLFDSILGVLDDDFRIVYECEKFIEGYADIFRDGDDNAEEGTYIICPRNDGESDEDYEARRSEEYYTESEQNFGTNTISDYGHSEERPIVVDTFEYMFEECLE